MLPTSGGGFLTKMTTYNYPYLFIFLTVSFFIFYKNKKKNHFKTFLTAASLATHPIHPLNNCNITQSLGSCNWYVSLVLSCLVSCVSLELRVVLRWRDISRILMPWPVLHVKLVVALTPTHPWGRGNIYIPCVIREVPGIPSFLFPHLDETPWRLSGRT